MNWHQLQYKYPKQVDKFYTWLAPFLKSKDLGFHLSFRGFFKAPAWLQISIFFQYLKASEVEELDVNPLDEEDCFTAIKEYFQDNGSDSDSGINVLSLFFPLDIEHS